MHLSRSSAGSAHWQPTLLMTCLHSITLLMLFTRPTHPHSSTCAPLHTHLCRINTLAVHLLYDISALHHAAHAVCAVRQWCMANVSRAVKAGRRFAGQIYLRPARMCAWWYRLLAFVGCSSSLNAWHYGSLLQGAPYKRASCRETIQGKLRRAHASPLKNLHRAHAIPLDTLHRAHASLLKTLHIVLMLPLLYPSTQETGGSQSSKQFCVSHK